MTRYNEGDILEILEDFTQLGARYKSGDKYKVAAITFSGYNLEPLQAGPSWSAYPQEFDRLEIVRKVEPTVEHMELGKTYQSTLNYLFYTPTEIDFEAGRVAFDYASEQDSFERKSTRKFYNIEEEFGVLPPVKPENEYTTVTAEEFRKEVQEAKAVARTEDVDGVDIGGWDREEFALDTPKPETVSVDALREALDFLGFQEVFDTENIISLAKRLS